jgi:hypothetical protein
MNLVNVEPLPDPARAGGCGAVNGGEGHEPPIPDLAFPHQWFDAPPETSAEFFPAFVRVSMALQAELRRLLPNLYLSDAKRFENTHMAYPLLVYGASRPFPGEPRTDFTYDILNREMMKMFYFSARTDLPAMLSSIWKRLRAAGLQEIAVKYRPDRSKRIIAAVQRLRGERRRLNQILTMETRMVNDLIGFAGTKNLSLFRQQVVSRRIHKAIVMRLRRIFAKYDFTALVREIIDAITPALLPPAGPPKRQRSRRRRTTPLRSRVGRAG